MFKEFKNLGYFHVQFYNKQFYEKAKRLITQRTTGKKTIHIFLSWMKLQETKREMIPYSPRSKTRRSKRPKQAEQKQCPHWATCLASLTTVNNATTVKVRNLSIDSFYIYIDEINAWPVGVPENIKHQFVIDKIILKATNRKESWSGNDKYFNHPNYFYNSLEQRTKHVFLEIKGCGKIGKNSALIEIPKFRERVAYKQHDNSGKKRKNAIDLYIKNHFVGSTKQ